MKFKSQSPTYIFANGLASYQDPERPLLCKVVGEWKKVDSLCVCSGVCLNLTVDCPTTTHTQVCSL